MLPNNIHLFPLPSEDQLILFLISEDLKSTRFFNGLADLGLEDSSYQSYFGTVVLALTGFADQSDELVRFYVDLLERRSRKITEDVARTRRQAFKIYVELMVEKKRRTLK